VAPAWVAWIRRWSPRLADVLEKAQHRNAWYLMLSQASAAAAGLLFWWLLTAVADVGPDRVGVGYAIVSMGATVGVLAKGGFDAALVRTVPEASTEDGRRLLWFAALVASSIAIALAVGLGLASPFTGALPDFGATGWALVAAIGALMVTTWLQDAYFMGEGDAKYSFHRNAVLSGARVAFPLLIVTLALPQPVALSWGLALAVSALAAGVATYRFPSRPGPRVPRSRFLRRALRNVTGGAAQFLPGLLLVPVILVINGPDAAGYFGIAWTAANLLFLVSSAIGRSALGEMAGEHPEQEEAEAIRKGTLQHLWIVAPAAVIGIAFAPLWMGIFGAGYADRAATSFRILCASSAFVSPFYLYLAVLRARDDPRPLVVFPALMIVALFLLAPPFNARWGFSGVAVAWFLANVPFGVYAAVKLREHAGEVMPDLPTPSVLADSHME
jgi:O-antigen/teichoic acid export membrane protein